MHINSAWKFAARSSAAASLLSIAGLASIVRLLFSVAPLLGPGAMTFAGGCPLLSCGRSSLFPHCVSSSHLRRIVVLSFPAPLPVRGGVASALLRGRASKSWCGVLCCLVEVFGSGSLAAAKVAEVAARVAGAAVCVSFSDFFSAVGISAEVRVCGLSRSIAATETSVFGGTKVVAASLFELRLSLGDGGALVFVV